MSKLIDTNGKEITGTPMLANMITVNALRKVLFNLDDQDMTVRELRSKLFEMNEDDKIVY